MGWRALFSAGLLFILGLLSHTSDTNSSTFVLRVPLGMMEPDYPADNVPTAERVRLGQRLFFDTSLSANGKISCASCHKPQYGFSDNVARSVGAGGRLTRRKTPSLLNIAFESAIMWDGRFPSLETQALDPFATEGDMGIDLGTLMDRLSATQSYVQMFREAFGGDLTTTDVGKAIASYERTLVSGNSRFDEYVYRSNPKALTRHEIRGYELFIGDGNCIRCHDIFDKSVNPLGGAYAPFTDYRYHNLGVGYDRGVIDDLGRYEITRDPQDWAAFRTPGLRDVAEHPPYMHDGSLKTLYDVVNFYDHGGNQNPNIAPALEPLRLTFQEKKDIVAFLKSLNGRP